MTVPSNGSKTTFRNPLLIAAAAVVVVIVLLVVGNLLYSAPAGSADSPTAFRELVAESGLVVDWTNNGRSAGDGVVNTDCGPRLVTVAILSEDMLSLSWEDQRVDLTAESARSFQACSEP